MVPPVLSVVKLTAAVAAPAHLVWSAGSLTCPLGLTVIVNVWAVPGHPSNEGVTVIVAVTGAVPVFVAVKEGILPVPLAPRPMLVLLFDHEKVDVPPLLVVTNVTAAVAVPLHLVWLAGSLTWPEGLTMTVLVIAAPGHDVGNGPRGVIV